jgi:hypothetical protein
MRKVWKTYRLSNNLKTPIFCHDALTLAMRLNTSSAARPLVHIYIDAIVREGTSDIFGEATIPASMSLTKFPKR